MKRHDEHLEKRSMRQKVKTLCLLGLVVVMAGCGGGSSSSSTNTPSPFSATYLTVSLTTGVYSPSTTSSATGTGTGTAKTLIAPSDTIVFRRLANGSYLATTEVTRYQWTLVMGTQPWTSVSASIQGSSSNSQIPANNLSRDDANAFAAAVAGRCALSATLPTTADFQDAFGGPGRDYPWSGTVVATAIATLRESGTEGPTPIGTHASVSDYYDLIGNVREWTTSGHLVGGGWLDNLAVAKISKAMLTVDPEIRHPLAGVRLIIRN